MKEASLERNFVVHIIKARRRTSRFDRRSWLHGIARINCTAQYLAFGSTDPITHGVIPRRMGNQKISPIETNHRKDQVIKSWKAPNHLAISTATFCNGQKIAVVQHLPTLLLFQCQKLGVSNCEFDEPLGNIDVPQSICLVSNRNGMIVAVERVPLVQEHLPQTYLNSPLNVAGQGSPILPGSDFSQIPKLGVEMDGNGIRPGIQGLLNAVNQLCVVRSARILGCSMHLLMKFRRQPQSCLNEVRLFGAGRHASMIVHTNASSIASNMEAMYI